KAMPTINIEAPAGARANALRASSRRNICSPRVSTRHATASAYAVACKLIGNAGIDRLGGSDIGVTFRLFSDPQLADAAAVKRGRLVWLDFQRCVIVRNSALAHAEFQVHEPAAVERIGETGTQP